MDGTKLCGYSQDASPLSNVWQFSMDQLAMVSCLQATKAVCSTVWITDVSSILMAVAVPPLRLSGSRRRRLLWEDGGDGQDAYAYDGDYEPFGAEDARAILAAPGWDTAAAPCAELVRRHQDGEKLATLERHELHRCAYWRFVGRRVIETLNLTGLAGHETFLLSADDLASTLAHKEALLELVTAPWAFAYALQYHPWLRPLRAAATVVANLAERTEWARLWLQSQAEDADEDPSELLDFVTGDEALDNTLHLESERFLNWSQWRAGLRSRRLVRPRRPATHGEPVSDANETKGAGRVRIARRGLLSAVSDLQLVQSISASIATGAERFPVVPDQVAQAWGQGPFVWPPNYQYGVGSCPVGVSVFGITREAFGVLVLYYANWDKPRPPIDRSIRASLPSIAWPSGASLVAQATRPVARGRNWASTAFHYVTGSLLGLRPADIVGFFSGSAAWSLQWLLEESVRCDLAAVVSCSRHKRDLLGSIAVLFVAYLLVRAVASAIGVPVLSTIFFYGLPSLLLWYVYGVGPTCFPLMPTCLLSDVIAAAQYLTPEAIEIPPELLCGAPAGNASAPAGNASCLRPCSDLNFTTWADTVAFAACDTDAGWCEALGRAGANTSVYQATLAPLFAPVQVQPASVGRCESSLTPTGRRPRCWRKARSSRPTPRRPRSSRPAACAPGSPGCPCCRSPAS